MAAHVNQRPAARELRFPKPRGVGTEVGLARADPKHFAECAGGDNRVGADHRRRKDLRLGVPVHGG